MKHAKIKTDRAISQREFVSDIKIERNIHINSTTGMFSIN